MDRDPPLNIVHYCPGIRLEAGGVVRAVLDWCALLAQRGNRITLATHNSPDIPPDWNGAAGKPAVVRLPAPANPNQFVGAAAVRSWENLLTGDVVAHLHTPWTLSNMQMARAARRRKVPYIVSIHGMLDDWSMRQRGLKKRTFLALGGRTFLRRADAIHYTAAAEREQAEKWIGNPRSVVLPPPVDLTPFQVLPGPGLARSKFSVEGDEPVILFLSRLHEKKGVHTLIDAAAALRQRGRPVNLLIAGTAAAADQAYADSLVARVDRLNLKSSVKFLGMVSGPEKVSLYQLANLLVLPTRQENFGLVLIEAMASGTPVLTTRGTDIWQELQAAGACICDNTAAALSESMEQLLSDRPALAELGRKGRAWALQQFDPEKLLVDYELLYARLRREPS